MDISDEFVLESDDELELTQNKFQNDDWLTNYIKEEEIFNKFYKKEIDKIKLYFFYIDKNKEIIKVLKRNADISGNIIDKNKIVNIINNNNKVLNKKFMLLQILKYNFNIDNNEINKFLKNKKSFNFLKKYDVIDDIYWENTIPLFKSLNSLYFIFFEKKKNNNTKRIRLKRKKKAKTKKKYNKEIQFKKSDIIKID